MTSTVLTTTDRTWSAGRASRELGLKRAEFDLAVQLGLIRAVPDEGGDAPRVTRAEIDRLTAQKGFPNTLRRRVRVVGTTEAAELVGVSPGRFTRLARLGTVSPVRFHVNRYRAVVWMYRAEELERFAADPAHTDLRTAHRLPETARAALDAGVDLRPRNWRYRHREFLLRTAPGPWEAAGVLAGFLTPGRLAEAVPDPEERARVMRLRPGPPFQSAPGSPSALVAEEIMTGTDPDEEEKLAGDLALALADARASTATATRTTHGPGTATGTHGSTPRTPRAAAGTPPAPARPHTREQARLGLLARLRLRRRAPARAGGPAQPGTGRRAPHTARNSPSCTTDTSSRPSRS